MIIYSGISDDASVSILDGNLIVDVRLQTAGLGLSDELKSLLPGIIAQLAIQVQNVIYTS